MLVAGSSVIGVISNKSNGIFEGANLCFGRAKTVCSHNILPGSFLFPLIIQIQKTFPHHHPLHTLRFRQKTLLLFLYSNLFIYFCREVKQRGAHKTG